MANARTSRQAFHRLFDFWTPNSAFSCLEIKIKRNKSGPACQISRQTGPLVTPPGAGAPQPVAPLRPLALRPYLRLLEGEKQSNMSSAVPKSWP